MQERTDARQDGCRTGRKQDRKDSGWEYKLQDGCKTVQMQDMMDAGHEMQVIFLLQKFSPWLTLNKEAEPMTTSIDW